MGFDVFQAGSMCSNGCRRLSFLSVELGVLRIAMQMRISKMYTCPVCGFSGLRRPPEDHLICASCGTQFGYDDAGPGPIVLLHEKLRRRWIQKGAHWYSQSTTAPLFWNPWDQLIRAHLAASLPYIERVEVTETFTIVNSDFGFREPNAFAGELMTA
jgi:ribosomal protein L37AE/L43A